MPNTNQARSTESAANVLDSIKSTAFGCFSKLRAVLQGMGFWKMALLCLGFRCLVLQPLGAVLALVVGTLWCTQNMDAIRRFHNMAREKVQKGTGSGIASSLWYENGGREKIEHEIRQMTDKGERFCNLAECVQLPHQSHWLAIAKALNAKGIQTQVSGDAFYIAWELSGKQA